MATNQRNGASHRIAIDFIDPLFAVVISISFVEVMQRPWFKAPSPTILADSAFDMVVLLLGYSTVVLSWVGYHLSIRGSPIQIEKFPGFLRFIFDTVLLGCYWLLLVRFEDFLFVLVMLAIITWVFVVWDQLKWWEYKDRDSTGSRRNRDSTDSRRRRGVSVFWAIIFTTLLFIYWKVEFGIGSSNTANWVFLGLGHFFTIIYRVHKNYLWPGKILDVLAFHAPTQGLANVDSLRIYIAGPYSGTSRDQVKKNVDRAIDAGVEVFQKGHFPYVPHLTDLVDARARETGNELTWEDFICWDMPWLRICDALLYLGKSKGADLEVAEAQRLEKKIFYSINDIPQATPRIRQNA